MKRDGPGRRFSNDIPPVAAILSEAYRDCCHGNKSNPLHELLYILCSLQTNETLYLSSYRRLRASFPTIQDLMDAEEREIAAAIEIGGLSRQKARVIRQILAKLETDFGRPTFAPLQKFSDEDCEAYLLSLPGVGKKTARFVMMYSLRREVFPVDSNCWRICRRLGWVRATRPDKSCSPKDMDRLQLRIPPNLRFALHVNMVSHGRECCLPSRPACEVCCIRKYCRTGRRELDHRAGRTAIGSATRPRGGGLHGGDSRNAPCTAVEALNWPTVCLSSLRTPRFSNCWRVRSAPGAR